MLFKLIIIERALLPGLALLDLLQPLVEIILLDIIGNARHFKCFLLAFSFQVCIVTCSSFLNSQVEKLNLMNLILAQLPTGKKKSVIKT